MAKINNPISGFRPVVTHSSRRLCFLSAYVSWSHQSMTGIPLFSPSNGYKVFLFAGASSAIRTTCPSQRSRWILIRCTTSMLLRSSYSSLLDWMRKSLPTRTGPKILRRTFLTNALKATASVRERSLLLNCLLRPNFSYIKNTAQCHL